MLKVKVLLSQTHVSAGENPEMTGTVELLMHKLGEKVNIKYVLEKRGWGAGEVGHWKHASHTH